MVIGMGAKLGRNDLCWCGSGKKYKRCHLDRERQSPPAPYEFLAKSRAILDQKYCLHPLAGPQCTKVSRAHTIQRNGGLDKIAVNGHVYMFGRDETMKTGEAQVKLIGIRAASTFNGFCNFHDNKTFEPIEKHPFTVSEEYAFLLAYRAICMEYYKKRGVFEQLDLARTLDKGRPIGLQIAVQDYVGAFKTGLDAAIRDLTQRKASYDAALTAGDYSGTKYYIVELADMPGFLCSSTLQPDYDFKGNVLQDLLDLDRVADHITMTILPTGTGGAVVFSWFGDSPAAVRFLACLDSFSDKQLAHAIVRYTFEYVENTCISPSWWDALDERTRSALVARFRASLDEGRARPPTALLDDGVRAVSWRVTNRVTNIDLT